MGQRRSQLHNGLGELKPVEHDHAGVEEKPRVPWRELEADGKVRMGLLILAALEVADRAVQPKARLALVELDAALSNHSLNGSENKDLYREVGDRELVQPKAAVCEPPRVVNARAGRAKGQRQREVGDRRVKMT